MRRRPRNGRIGSSFDDFLKEEGTYETTQAIAIKRVLAWQSVNRENSMEAIKILDKSERLDWDYDRDADVLYVSLGPPKKGVGVDIGEGIIVRYDKSDRKVIGVTILGFQQRVVDSLPKANGGTKRNRRTA